MQKKILTCLAAALFCLNTGSLALAATANWQNRSGGTVYDTNSLRRIGSVVEVTERSTAGVNNKGAKLTVLQNQYDVEGQKWRTVNTQLFNGKGVKLVERKGPNKWQTYQAGSAQAVNAQFYADSTRLQGNWIQAKTINEAVIYFDAATIKHNGKDGIDVWEKTVINKAANTNEVKSVVSHMKYNLKTRKVDTVYNCNFNAQGTLLKASAELDSWGADNDPYGEYIGKELHEYLKKNKEK